ncbi:unnamed protein product [Rangifer tarandus platyrhynchus]|uniref:Uncharacterized protein n=1 Tax=Rangifer tarandus platyrhynchus TaxID=3082113 RepID=A0AC59YN12_RANTA
MGGAGSDIGSPGRGALSTSRWVGRTEDRGGWTSSKGVKECQEQQDFRITWTQDVAIMATHPPELRRT